MTMRIQVMQLRGKDAEGREVWQPKEDCEGEDGVAKAILDLVKKLGKAGVLWPHEAE